MARLTVTGCVVLAVMAATWLATRGSIEAVAAVVLAGFTLLWTMLGQRLGIGLLLLGYLLAPLDKAPILQVGGPSVTATDLILLAGFALVLPRLLRSRLHLAPAYLLGVAVTVVTGLLASVLVATDAGSSVKSLIGWDFCMVLIPVGIAALQPSRRLIRGFAWAYVAGQAFDTIYSFAQDPTTAIRHQGLTQHPNAFGEAGLVAFALLLYLRTASGRRWLVHAAMGVSLVAIYLSGSRAATLVAAGLVLVLPFVERRARVGVGVVGLGVVGSMAALFLWHAAGAASSVDRLTGNAQTAASDNVRATTLADGWHLFLAHPLTGSGLVDVGIIHVNVLEIAVGCGVFGVVGYLLVVGSLARPLLGSSPDRLLAMPVLAMAAWGLTAPALADRGPWVAIALGVAVFGGHRRPVPAYREPVAEAAAAEEPVLPTGRPRLAI